MKGFILNIYDFLSSHKGLAALILGIIVGFCGLSASRLTFNEDITDFLPQREEVKGQEKMNIFALNSYLWLAIPIVSILILELSRKL